MVAARLFIPYTCLNAHSSLRIYFLLCSSCLRRLLCLHRLILPTLRGWAYSPPLYPLAGPPLYPLAKNFLGFEDWTARNVVGKSIFGIVLAAYFAYMLVALRLTLSRVLLCTLVASLVDV